MTDHKKLGDETLMVKEGGDFHQLAQGKTNTLTTQTGTPISDDQNTLKTSGTGPTLMEDFIFREKLFHFDHERIPERVVHARGFGAHGYFEAYDSLKSVTKAHPFQKKGRKTPVFVRFSTVAGNQGSADLARDVRGFAVKFYTEEGNWDLVGNNIPVFFIQDPIKFPDLIHAAKDEPDRGFPQAQTAHDNFWDFISLTPESMHMVMWIMSDRTLPRSFRFMEGFGVHTFRFVNAEGKSTFVKFHWKPKLGLQSVFWDEAVKINGADPDYHRRDLWHSIQQGDFPEWELGVQLFDEDFVASFPFDVLDATKLIPEEDVPVQLVGRMVLDRCVDNFFAETEQVAFCTQNIIPGIDFTNDPLLQGRNFSYLDTQLKRLGSTNFNQLPINAPRCPFAHFQQDGHMAFMNPQGRVNYQPNSWGTGPRPNLERGFHSYGETIEGVKARVRSETFADHYSQAKQFYLSQTAFEQQHIQDALAFELSQVENPAIRERMVAHLLNIDGKMAQYVAEAVGLTQLPLPCDVAKMPVALRVSDKLSILKSALPLFKGRKVGILIEDSANADMVKRIVSALKKVHADFDVIAPRIGQVTLSNGKSLAVHKKIGAGLAVMYDAVIVLLQHEGELLTHPKSAEFLHDAFFNKKFIGYTPAAQALFQRISLTPDEGCFDITHSAVEFIQACHAIRHWDRQHLS